MNIHFEKWHGCQNDFLVVWLKSSEIGTIDESLKRRAQSICSKSGDGVGADGILVLEVMQPDDFVPKRLIIINSDGSVAKNCGNGLRCAAGSVLQRARSKSVTDLQSVEIPVEGQSIFCQFLATNKNRLFPYIAVTMPPTLINEVNAWFKDIREQCQKILDANGIIFENFYGVEIYNRHLVVVLDSLEGKMQLTACAKDLQQVLYGDGINVHFIVQKNPTQIELESCQLNTGGDLVELFEVFIYERGVGVTRACGSGAVAIASLSIQAGFVDAGEFVGVKSSGGILYVSQSDEKNLKLVGPALKVFAGTLEL